VPPKDGALHLLVCAGDLSHPRKNINDAIRAAALLARPDRPVIVRAVGGNAGSLEAKAKRAKVAPGARFELKSLGVLAPADVQREMRRSHALLLPSLYEEWGYVAIESILSGSPVVSYPVYPFADLLTGGLGVVAEERSPVGLAAGIEQALTLPRGGALVKAGEARFGSRAMGMLLTQIWTDLRVVPSEIDFVPSSLPPAASVEELVALQPSAAAATQRDSKRPSQHGLASDRPSKSVRPARSDYPVA